MDISDYYEGIYEYIRALPDDEKAPDDVYKRRLDICLGCEYASNATCLLCGCFFEVRAAKKDGYCAKGSGFWQG